jgi:hypothetical protein
VTTHNPPISAAQREFIVRSIAEHYHWDQADYELELLEDWDNERLPIVLAIPRERIPFSPKFALLPRSRELVADSAPDALERILAEVFRSIGPEDAPALAELALMFGRFSAPVGRLWTRALVGRLPGDRLPRQEAKPVYRKEGDAHVVEFYSYDGELQHFYDCSLRVEKGTVGLKATKLK